MISWVDSVKMQKRVQKRKQKECDKNELALKIGFIIMPLLLSLLIMIPKWISQGFVALPGVKWNDEAVYIKLIQTYSKFFTPKGYWGFDANHALFGTGSAWSPAILFPYLIPAIIFPVGYSFVYVCNMIYVMGANAAFLFLTKPKKSNLIKLILAQVSSIVFILYLNTNMSEMFRYALAILIAGLLYKMLFDNCPKWIKYALTPIVIVYAVQVYTFFAFCIPIYVFALLKKKKLWVKLVVSVIATAGIAVVSYAILHLISSNYAIGKTESLLAFISEGHILLAIKSFAGMIIDGAKGLLDLRFYVKTNGLYIFHVMIALLLIVSSIITIFSKNIDKEDRAISIIVAYSVAIFFFAYMTLYTIVPDTFTRGTEIAVIFSIYLLMMTKDKYLAWAIIVCNATGLLFLPVNLRTFQGNERYYTREERVAVKEWADEMKYVINMDDSSDPWDNTILLYTMEPRAILAMPEGMGLNFVLHNDYYGSDAKYIFIPRFSHSREDWIEQSYGYLMAEYGVTIEYYYECIYEKDGYFCYKRKE